ncbi:MAG TPA: cytochrome P450 [Acidimicrobiia bacterium]|jgi:cytochrome P450
MATTEIHEDLAAEALRYLTDPAFRADPHDFLDRLRATEPVHRTPAGVWLVSRHADALAVLRDDVAWSRRLAAEKHVVVDDPLARAVFTARMLFNDKPEHTRMRRLVAAAFTPAGVRRWEAEFTRIAEELLDEIEPRRAMDAVAEFGYPYAERVICFMLGVPFADHALWEAWAKTMVEPPAGADMAAFKEAATAATLEFTDYVRALVADRQGREGDDLLSRLILAEEEGTRLSETELVAMTFELILAGHETTANAIPNGIWLLLRHPDQLDRLRREPAAMAGAVEEILRYESPAPMAMTRVATTDVELGGTIVPAGESVLVLLSAANRDPDAFVDPQAFDAFRPDNAQIGFGTGGHYCLGAALARIELNIVFPALFNRLPGLRPAGEGPPRWKAHQFFRTLESLPVAW